MAPDNKYKILTDYVNKSVVCYGNSLILVMPEISDFKPEELMPAEMITAVAEQRETIEDEFDELPPENPITQLNDLYELNGHRLAEFKFQMQRNSY